MSSADGMITAPPERPILTDILTALADDMPEFKRILDTVSQKDMKILSRQYEGFSHYAVLLEEFSGRPPENDNLTINAYFFANSLSNWT